jgi:hypothetical protein
MFFLVEVVRATESRSPQEGARLFCPVISGTEKSLGPYEKFLNEEDKIEQVQSRKCA